VTCVAPGKRTRTVVSRALSQNGATIGDGVGDGEAV
jgi:hypothetical protein